MDEKDFNCVELYTSHLGVKGGYYPTEICVSQRIDKKKKGDNVLR